ncbi:MAG: flagellar basal body rod protein FlgB [Planctomycetes bacterium]|nr:flagellar basal body rod protein FlgB [Planctomycetota bacterium]
MLEKLFRQGSIPTLEKGISFTAQRHKVLANNIANADTVFYRAQDLPVEEFRKTLSRSIEARRRDPVGVFRWDGDSRMPESSLGGIEVEAAKVRGRRSTRGALRHDKNNVSVELEMAKLGQNSMLHTVMLDLLRKKFRAIDGALSERVE